MLLASESLFYVCLHHLQPSVGLLCIQADSPPRKFTPVAVAHYRPTSRHRFVKQGVKERTQDLKRVGTIVDATQALILLIHPIAALLVIREFNRQRKWRALSTILKGEERTTELQNHERAGDLMLRYVILVIGIGFLSHFVVAIVEGESIRLDLLIPGHFHGWGGFLGLALTYYLWNLGKKTSRAKELGNKFTMTKNLHGKVSDVIMILITIHAFLGFLYLLQLIG